MRSSKESLRILFDNACDDKEGFIPLMNECYTNLEKDLEVLEILLASLLKKPITNGTNSNKMILLDSESYNKIKELLENESMEM